jgi:hypothetical protein
MDHHITSLTKQQLEQRFDRILRDKQALDKQRQDRLVTTLSNTLTTAVNAKLDKLIKAEMKNSVLPGLCGVFMWSIYAMYTTGQNHRLARIYILSMSVIQSAMSSLLEELSGSVAERLTATDVAMKEGLDRLITSKVSSVLIVYSK